MNTTEVIAWAHDADVYCPACAEGAAWFDPEDGEGCAPFFCGAEVDVPQHCAHCREEIEEFSVLTRIVRVRCAVEKKVHVPLGLTFEQFNQNDRLKNDLLEELEYYGSDWHAVGLVTEVPQ